MALTIPFQFADNLPLIPEDADAFAYIVNVKTGRVEDVAYNFDTAINYIQELRFIAIAIRDWTPN